MALDNLVKLDLHNDLSYVRCQVITPTDATQ